MTQCDFFLRTGPFALCFSDRFGSVTAKLGSEKYFVSNPGSMLYVAQFNQTEDQFKTVEVKFKTAEERI